MSRLNQLMQDNILLQVCSTRCEKNRMDPRSSVAPGLKKNRIDPRSSIRFFSTPGATDLQLDNIKIQTSRSKPKFIFLLCFFVLTLFLVLSKFCSKELVLNAFIRSKQIYTAKIFYARESVTTFPPGKLVSFWRKLATCYNSSRFRVFCS